MWSKDQPSEGHRGHVEELRNRGCMHLQASLRHRRCIQEAISVHLNSSLTQLHTCAQHSLTTLLGPIRLSWSEASEGARAPSIVPDKALMRRKSL